MRSQFVVTYKVGIVRQCNSRILEELKCKCWVFLLFLAEMSHLSSAKEQGCQQQWKLSRAETLGSLGSLRSHCTIGEVFWAISPSVAVTLYLSSTKQSFSGPSEDLTDWELCMGRWVGKTSSICMICFNACHFRFKMHLNNQPRLIPAAWILLYSAIDLITSSVSFLLLWILSGIKKILFSTLCCHWINLLSPIPMLNQWCRSSFKNLQLLQEFQMYIFKIHLLPLDLIVF